MKKYAVCLLLFAFISCDFKSLVVKKDDKKEPVTKEENTGEKLNTDFSYKEKWEEVYKYSNKGLPKSALKSVEEILVKARKEKNDGQIIRALIHRIHYIHDVEEESPVKIQKALNDELKNSYHPLTPLLHSMIAEQYWNYYQRYRYRFLRRTATAKFEQEDMRTWDLRKIVEEVVRHYKKSLDNPEKLKSTRIDVFDEVLSKGNSNHKYRPTLYDFLAHRAVDFFMDSEAGLTKPLHQFSINNKKYFKEAKEFSGLKIESADPLSFHYYALAYLQDLIRFHMKDGNIDALVDVDLKRLKFVYSKAVIPNKEGIYEKILIGMRDKYQSDSAAADINYELADLYNSLGEKYVPERAEQYKWYKKKAALICRDIMKKYPETLGANHCESLLNQIEAKNLRLTLEEVVIPGKPFKALVNYKNTKKIYLRIVKTSWKEKEKNEELGYHDRLEYFKKKKAHKAWDVALPGDGDYQEHLCEIMFKDLKPGFYMLLAANSKGFDTSEHAVAYKYFNVSGIAFVERRRGKAGLELHIMNRDSGQPLTKAKVQLWYQDWSMLRQRYVWEKGKIYRTNEKGYLNIPFGSVAKTYFQLEFINGKDMFRPGDEFSIYDDYRHDTSNVETFFFMDRAIYRPGQTVYFKGIKLDRDSRDGEKTKIIAKSFSRVVLYDVNHQKVSELDLTTNEFGTYSGSFKLPLGLLNGRMSITDGYGTKYFSVEEYKRPKFQVIFDPAEESYRLKDNVLVQGRAEAYAGYNIDNAIVKYRVVRNVFYPYSWYFWGYMPSSPQMEILNGTAKTDSKGRFSIKFKAVPDLSVPRENMPAFRYTVYADVTDQNGETRSSSKNISIGYTALKLHISFNDNLPKEDEEYEYSINSTNLSYEFIKAKGTIDIYRLKTPDRILRARLWAKPDKYIMKKEDYYKNFPNDTYNDENNINKWERIKKVDSREFDTAKSKNITLNKISAWETGKYLIEMRSKDRFGNQVKEIKYFTLYSKKEKTMPDRRIEWISIPERRVEPGKNAEIFVGSSDKNVTVIYEVEYRGSITERKYFNLNNEQKRITIPIREKHRGNIGFHIVFVKHNRVYSYNENIYVPWSNKDLKISFETFRNKLYPGEKEEWRLKIQGKKKDKIAAEMVAALYDSSLDAFVKHGWYFNIFPEHYPGHSWGGNTFGILYTNLEGKLKDYTSKSSRIYDRLNWFGFYWRYYYMSLGGSGRKSARLKQKKKNGDEPSEAIEDRETDDVAKTTKEERKEDKPAPAPEKANADKSPEEDLTAVKARSNFNETAFFYPHLKTNSKGEIIIAFKIPESLTSWKMLGFAHTGDLEYGFVQNELVTQKDLMVVPNAPRFFREDDTLVFTSKVTNLTEKELKGQAALLLFDAVTMRPVDSRFGNSGEKISFSAKKGESDLLKWKIKIPDDLDAVTYRVVAKAGKFSDGEEMAIPILKNRMLVTESLPLPVRSKQTKEFKFKKFIESGKSSTLRHHKLTLEFTSNPAWYAVQALPYLMEYPYECMEQTFSRYYANSIASYIVNKDPKIKRVFDKWASAKDSNALLSNLEKNQELKSLLLQETPWVMNAKDETQRKKRVSLLFDLNRMSDELGRALKKLYEGQHSSGAWPWFKGMKDNRYITQHIVSGFAHLNTLKVIDARKSSKIWNMIQKAVPYLDREMRDDYKNLIKYNVDLEKNNLGYMQIHYLYARSYFQDIPVSSDCKKAFDYYSAQAGKYWNDFDLYMKGMLSLTIYRYKDEKTAMDIIKSIKEHALYSEEMGMYWKTSYGYYWYQAPIETHALLIEAFSEVAKDQKSVDDLKTWLLKQKQTQDWKTTKATADACYALLLQGDDWLAENELAEITLGNIKVDPSKMEDVKVEAGTGYFKTSWSARDIVPDMGNVKVVNRNNVAAWGGLYWQYFENLDKITPHETPLKLKRKLFVERSSSTGPVLYPIDKERIKIGDRIKVRIELRVDRSMEYVHMKDMRASAFEPENVLSSYKWQDGLGYYETTKDASTNFFFDYLPKGTYVFEYPLRITHNGDFSNGVTSIQCMYAPEFSSHSEGVRVKIE